jgi:hypothetical protein
MSYYDILENNERKMLKDRAWYIQNQEIADKLIYRYLHYKVSWDRNHPEFTAIVKKMIAYDTARGYVRRQMKSSDL